MRCVARALQLLGQRWAQLAPEERQAWSGRPAGHRRSLSGGTSSSGARSAQQQQPSGQRVMQPGAADPGPAGQDAEPAPGRSLYRHGSGGATPPSSYDSAKEART